MRFFFLLLTLFLGSLSFGSAAVQIVAAENFYGQVAKEIGGDDVEVTSILSNPSRIPSLHRQRRDRQGRGPCPERDPERYRLRSLDGRPDHRTSPATIAGHPCRLAHSCRSGDNPIWYNPATMPALREKAYRRALRPKSDPAHAKSYEAIILNHFLASLKPLTKTRSRRWKSHLSGRRCHRHRAGLRLHVTLNSA